MKRSGFIKRSGFRLKRTGAMKVKRKSKVATDWASQVRKRDNYTCRWPGCGYYSVHIHAHHIHPRSQRPELKWELSNGASLCNQHHMHLHFDVEGRRKAIKLGLLGVKTYEAAMKEREAA